MTQVFSTLSRRCLVTFRSYPYTLIALVFFSILGVFLCLRQSSADWEGVYLPAAARLARGENIFQDGFTYPPINAWLPLPFVDMPRIPGRLLWFLINAAALTVVVCGAWRLSGGARLQGAPPAARREHLIFGLGLLCAIYYALDAFTNQQSDLVVAALLIVGCLALVHGRDLSGGFLLGLSAAIKCTPLLGACYLAWRRRWAGAVLIPVVAIAVNLIPDLTHPPTTPTPRLEEWARTFLLPMGNRSYDYGTWASAMTSNHSLGGMWNRWLTQQVSWQGGELHHWPSENRVSPEMLKIVALGSMLFFLAAALLCSWKAGRAAGDGEAQEPGPSRMSLELSLMVILMLLLSPQSSKPHFCTLLLPGFCLARAALNRTNRLLRVLVLAVVACGLVSNKDMVGCRVYDWALWHGSVTLSAVLLYAGCCLALARRQPAVAVMSDTEMVPGQRPVIPFSDAARTEKSRRAA
jgi:hypothetical protein